MKKSWYVIWSFEIYLCFYGNLVIQNQFGTFLPVLVYCVKKTLATLCISAGGRRLNFACKQNT
jgi:hypothetical protein